MKRLGTGVGLINLNFQIGSLRTIIFDFGATDISSWTFILFIKKFKGDRTNVLSYTSAAGLTFPIYSNQVSVNLSAADTQIEEGEYYWELRRTDASVPLLAGKAYFDFDPKQGTEDTDGYSMNTTIDVTVSNGSGSSAVVGTWVIQSKYNASAGMWPQFNGILAGYAYPFSVGGTINGVFYPAGTIALALINGPGQTDSNWRAI